MNLKRYFCFSVFFWSFPAFADTDPCSTLADLESQSNSSVFVGFSAGASQKEADQNAQVDLARNIRQDVTSTSTVNGNNEKLSLTETSKSVVSESLMGAKVLRRCSLKDTFSTVVTLDKKLFLSSLEKKLTLRLKKAAGYAHELETQDDESLGQTVTAAKKFLSDYRVSSESDLELCKVYSSCVKIENTNAFADLENALVKVGDKDQYLFTTTQSDLAHHFEEDLITLIENSEGIKIVNKAAGTDSVKKKIKASCKAQFGTAISGTDDRIVEVRCTAEGYVGKQRSFRKVYSCKSVADSTTSKEEAVNACSGRLISETIVFRK